MQDTEHERLRDFEASGNYIFFLSFFLVSLLLFVFGGCPPTHPHFGTGSHTIVQRVLELTIHLWLALNLYQSFCLRFPSAGIQMYVIMPNRN